MTTPATRPTTPFVAVQRVFPPERVLLYKSLFLFILVGLLTEWWRHRAANRAIRRWSQIGMAALGLLYVGYQVNYVEYLNGRIRPTVAAYRAGYDWLRAQPAGAVLAPEPLHDLYFRYWAHESDPSSTWRSDMTARPARQYAYVVAFPRPRGAFQPFFPYPPAFHNAEVEIFVVPAAESPVQL